MPSEAQELAVAVKANTEIERSFVPLSNPNFKHVLLPFILYLLSLNTFSNREISGL